MVVSAIRDILGGRVVHDANDRRFTAAAASLTQRDKEELVGDVLSGNPHPPQNISGLRHTRTNNYTTIRMHHR